MDNNSWSRIKILFSFCLLIEAFLLFSDGLLEALLEQRQFGNEVSDGVHEGLLGRVLRGRLDPQDDIVVEGMGVLVAGEEHVRVLEELHTDHVTQGMVLLERKKMK